SQAGRERSKCDLRRLVVAVHLGNDCCGLNSEICSARFSPKIGYQIPSMTTQVKTLLCIDDHESSVAGWCLYLQNAGYSVETAHSAQEGLELFAVRPIDLVLLDYAMPDRNGGEVAATMKRMKPDVCILMLSGV